MKPIKILSILLVTIWFFASFNAIAVNNNVSFIYATKAKHIKSCTVNLTAHQVERSCKDYTPSASLGINTIEKLVLYKDPDLKNISKDQELFILYNNNHIAACTFTINSMIQECKSLSLPLAKPQTIYDIEIDDLNKIIYILTLGYQSNDLYQCGIIEAAIISPCQTIPDLIVKANEITHMSIRSHILISDATVATSKSLVNCRLNSMGNCVDQQVTFSLANIKSIKQDIAILYTYSTNPTKFNIYRIHDKFTQLFSLPQTSIGTVGISAANLYGTGSDNSPTDLVAITYDNNKVEFIQFTMQTTHIENKIEYQFSDTVNGINPTATALVNLGLE